MSVSAPAFVTVIAWIFPLAMIYAGWRDVVSFEVPNWVSLSVVAGFAAYAPMAGMTVTALAWHFSAGAAVLLVGWCLFAFGQMGGADAKILAAAAVWTGWTALAEFVVAVALCGGVLALLFIVWRRTPLPASWAEREWVCRLHDRDGKLPYCAAIGCAGLWIFPRLPIHVAAS